MSINVHPVNDKVFPIRANFNGYGEQKFTLLAAKELSDKLLEAIKLVEQVGNHE